MPQLDPTSFASQLFWLAVTFIFLYWVLAAFCLPKLAQILQSREQKIQGDISLAREMSLEAERMEQDYAESLKDARDKSSDIVNDAVAQINKLRDAKLVDLSAKIKQKEASSIEIIKKMEKTASNDAAKIAKDLSGDLLYKVAEIKLDDKVIEKAVEKAA